ncbi:MAG: hypothetical protein ACU85E_03530 [Gammaproteobacteria bacterium]
MAYAKNLFVAVLISIACLSCSLNNKPPEIDQESSGLLPKREEAVGYFSRMHTFVRDTERAAYDLMYGVRDGVDSFIYDAQKDYYENYQK